MIRLQSGKLVCELQPQLGGCIAGLWLDGVPVLRSTREPFVSARQSGSYPLVPFSNRVARATLQWQGTSHPLVSNNAPEPHAIHGVAWPFAFDSSQVLRLRGHALELTLALTNQSPSAAPAGLGWHPYFVKRPRSRIAFEASGRWEMGADKLPTVRRGSPGLDVDCAALDVDHCFDGWNGVAELRDESLHTRITSDLSRLVVFTDAGRDCIAIEPVSHVNNAVNLAAAGADPLELGLQTLQPGQTLTAQMTIAVESAT